MRPLIQKVLHRRRRSSSGVELSTPIFAKVAEVYFSSWAQPFSAFAVERDISGVTERQQEPSLNRKDAEPELQIDAGRDGGVMSSMRNWMLGAAIVAAGLGAGATTAQAAEFGVYVRGPVAPVAYVAPCPGPGYFWVGGYRAHGYWYPGRWEFRGVRGGGPVVRFGGRYYGRYHR